MKRLFVLLVLIACVFPVFAAKITKIESLDEFGDPTGSSYLTFDQDLSGTYKNTSSKGSLKWNIVMNPNTGGSFLVLKENGMDVDVTTSSYSPYYLDTDATYKVSFKAADGSITTLYGTLYMSETYKTNNLVLYTQSSLMWGGSPYNCRELFCSSDVFKVSITSDYGSYTLGSMDTTGLEDLLFDDSLYKQGVELMNEGRYQEAIDVFESLKEKDRASYNHFKTDAQVSKCYILGEIWVVGGSGPSGGYIFYDCDSDNDSGNADGLVSAECGWRYLEAAPSDLKVVDGVPIVDSNIPGYENARDRFEFGYNKPSSVMIGTSTDIGTGKENSEKLGFFAYDYDGNQLEDSAAGLCSRLVYEANGKTFEDWFLPSKDELNLMYENLFLKGKGSFMDYPAYWSSSESGADYAWRQTFNGWGFQDDDYRRGNEFLVRPVRAF